MRPIATHLFSSACRNNNNRTTIMMMASASATQRTRASFRYYNSSSSSDPTSQKSTRELLDSVLKERLTQENVRDFQQEHPEIYGRIAREAVEKVKKDKGKNLDEALKDKVTVENHVDSYRSGTQQQQASAKRRISARERDRARMDSYRPRESVPKKDSYRYKTTVEKARAYKVKRPN